MILPLRCLLLSFRHPMSSYQWLLLIIPSLVAVSSAPPTRHTGSHSCHPGTSYSSLRHLVVVNRPLTLIIPAPHTHHTGPSHSSYRPFTFVIPAPHTRHTGESRYPEESLLVAGVPLPRECRGIGHRRPASPASCCPNASFKSAPISRPCVSSSTSRLPFQPITQPRQFIDFGDETPFPPSFRSLVVVTPAPHPRHTGPSPSSFRPPRTRYSGPSYSSHRPLVLVPASHIRHSGPPPSSFRRKPESRGHVPERLTIRITSTPLSPPGSCPGQGSNSLPRPPTFRHPSTGSGTPSSRSVSLPNLVKVKFGYFLM